MVMYTGTYQHSKTTMLDFSLTLEEQSRASLCKLEGVKQLSHFLSRQFDALHLFIACLQIGVVSTCVHVIGDDIGHVEATVTACGGSCARRWWRKRTRRSDETGERGKQLHGDGGVGCCFLTCCTFYVTMCWSEPRGGAVYTSKIHRKQDFGSLTVNQRAMQL